MLSLKHILVATDFSAISVAALRHALGIARRYQSNVSVLHSDQNLPVQKPKAFLSQPICLQNR